MTARSAWPDRFRAKVDTSAGLFGCWIWAGAKSDRGYGQIQVAGKTAYAHRTGYELIAGAIPEGLQIDHLCRVQLCVNPSHLEAVTPAVNNLRSESVSARSARATHCLHGHPFDSNNVYHRPGTHQRMCRECGRSRRRKRYQTDPEYAERVRERMRQTWGRKRAESQADGVHHEIHDYAMRNEGVA